MAKIFEFVRYGTVQKCVMQNQREIQLHDTWWSSRHEQQILVAVFDISPSPWVDPSSFGSDVRELTVKMDSDGLSSNDIANLTHVCVRTMRKLSPGSQ